MRNTFSETTLRTKDMHHRLLQKRVSYRTRTLIHVDLDLRTVLIKATSVTYFEPLLRLRVEPDLADARNSSSISAEDTFVAKSMRFFANRFPCRAEKTPTREAELPRRAATVPPVWYLSKTLWSLHCTLYIATSRKLAICAQGDMRLFVTPDADVSYMRGAPLGMTCGLLYRNMTNNASNLGGNSVWHVSDGGRAI